MTTDGPTNQHDKRYCGARKRQGEGNCTRPAGWGTNHVGDGTCKLHGGSTPSAQQFAMKQIAIREAQTFGLPRDIDPRAALLEEVHRTAGHVAWLQTKVAELQDDDIVFGITEVSRSTGKDGDTVKQTAAVNVWVGLYKDERKHLIDVCRSAIAAGIEERRVKLAEEQGALMATVIRGILADLNLTAEQTALVGDIVPKHLRQLTNG